MKIMLDCSPRKIAEYTERYDYEFWQLRTPLTNYKLAGVPYGLDNGCFSQFNFKAWVKLVEDADRERPLFVTVPDMVGDAQRTAELYEHFAGRYLRGLPLAYVLQDNQKNVQIPWSEIDAVFVGGKDSFKHSDECLNAVRTGVMIKRSTRQKLYVHIGRVNSWDRADWWLRAGEKYGFKVDSVDGSGMSRFDERLEVVLSAIRDERSQPDLLESVA
jgi:hypothetical protein